MFSINSFKNTQFETKNQQNFQTFVSRDWLEVAKFAMPDDMH